MSKGKTRKIDIQMRQIGVDSYEHVQINAHFYPLLLWRFVCNYQRHYTVLLLDRRIAVNIASASPSFLLLLLG